MSLKEGRFPIRPIFVERRTRDRRSLGRRLFFRRWRRRLRGAARSFFNPEGPMRFDLLALRFRRNKYAAGFLAQLLCHLVRYRTRLLIVGGRNNAEAAHAHLHSAWINLAMPVRLALMSGSAVRTVSPSAG